jgi:hypothetical protein
MEKEADFTFPKCGFITLNKTAAFLLDTRTFSVVQFCLLPGPRYYTSQQELSTELDSQIAVITSTHLITAVDNEPILASVPVSKPTNATPTFIELNLVRIL